MTFKFSTLSLLILISSIGLYAHVEPINFTHSITDELLTLITSKIEKQDLLFNTRNERINEIREILAYTQLDKGKRKALYTQLDLNVKLKQSIQDKINSYLFVQTQIHQLQYLSNLDRSKEITKIKDLITKIDGNKIDFAKLQSKQTLSCFAQSSNEYLPKIDCNLEKSSNGKIIANQYTLLFSFTPNELEKYYSDTEFLNAYVKLLKAGKKYFLEFKFDFYSLKARQMYGIIEESSPMKLLFIDEDYLYLQNSVTVPSEIETKTGKTIYKMQCSLSKSDFKKIKKKELDQLIILWPTGSETYELLNLHLLQELASCLQNY